MLSFKTSNNYPYYLVKRTCDPYITNVEEKDSYNYTVPANLKVIKGHYPVLFKETKEEDLYFLDSKKTALSSCFSVVGISPRLEVVLAKRSNCQ